MQHTPLPVCILVWPPKECTKFVRCTVSYERVYAAGLAETPAKYATMGTFRIDGKEVAFQSRPALITRKASL